MRTSPLDKFGKFVMRELRDQAIDFADGLLRANWKAPALRDLQRSLRRLTPKHRELVRRVVQESIDSAIHDFLFALQQRADFERDIRVIVDGKDIVAMSDGIHGEALGEEGWIRRFSAHRQPKRMRPRCD